MPRLTLVALALALSASPDAPPDRAARTVVLDADRVALLDLRIAPVEERTFEETVFALGRLRVAPGHRAVVSSRIAGRVREVEVHVDTPIESGARALTVESRQPGDPPPVIPLTAPMGGIVSAVHVVPGQPVSPDDVLVEIVDLADIHAVAMVPEHAVGRLRVGQSARIRVHAHPDREYLAELAHLGAMADGDAGALEAAFHVANPDLALRPGMRAEFSIVVASRPNVLAVPREALLGDATGRLVFLADPDAPHAFLRTPVTPGARNDQWVEIVRGLTPGDRVVTRGAYPLLFAGQGAASLRAALDAAHGHSHGPDDDDHDHEDDHDDGADDHGHSHGHSHRRVSQAGPFPFPLDARMTGILAVVLGATALSAWALIARSRRRRRGTEAPGGADGSSSNTPR